MFSLKDKLRRFIKQYYLNKMIRGLIILGISFIVLLLVFVTIEFFGWFNSGTRAFLFYLYLFVNLSIFAGYVILPLSKVIGLIRGISYERAARIIGDHFEKIEDKLLNILQLQKLGGKSISDSSYDLLIAAIKQKEEEIKPFPFVRAIDFKRSLRSLRYLVPGVVVFFAIISFKPDFITEPAYRISNYRTYFEKPAPFKFVLLNDDELVGIAKERYTLTFKTEGTVIPNEAYVEINDINYRANKLEKNLFSFDINNLQSDVRFRLNSLDYFSPIYTVKVIPRPAVRNFKVELNYPNYINRKNEVIDNVGDLIVPRGTFVRWIFNTTNADDLILNINDKSVKPAKSEREEFRFSKRAMDNVQYSVQPINEFIDTLGKVNYTIEVVPDEYPLIKVEEIKDSLNHFMIYFTGEIADDYGFTSLKYVFAQVRNDDTINEQQKQLPLNGNELRQRFMHYSDLQAEGFVPGDKLLWYFEVKDNDQISGPKSSRTYIAQYRIPGYEELDEATEKLQQEIKDKLENTIRSARAIQNEADKLNHELRNKKNLNWQDRERVNQLLNKQHDLKNQIQKIQEKLDYKNQKEQMFKQIDEDILEKQKLLQELMDKLLDDETRKLLDEIQELMDNLDKEKVDDMLKKINFSNEELSRELERNLELFKQMEIEKELRESIEELKKLADEQDKLAKESDNQTKTDEKLTEEQEKLNEKFDRLSDKIDNVREKNKELEFPNKIDDTSNEQESIKDKMQQSLDQLDQGNPQNASPNQRDASQQMQRLSDKLSDMYDQMMEEQLVEDILTLRQILKNLIHLSFEQEDLMLDTEATSRQDPKFPEIINQQNSLIRDFKIVEDSLVALGKRQTAIQSVVSREISSIKNNMDEAVSNLLDIHTVAPRNRAGKSIARERQQFAMTSMNNLALLLAEALDNMREQLNSQGGMGGQCPKSGCGSGSMQRMRQRQQSLNDQLQQLRDQLNEEGGQQPGDRRSGLSEQFARMAAEQQAIRRALQQYLEELRQQGLMEPGNLSEIMKQMEKTEEELVNRIINQTTLHRQEEITTRLLESERAERVREQEEQREATEAKNQIFSNPSLFLEYKRITEREKEMLRYSTPQLQLFYKNKVNEFIIKQETMN